LATSRCYHCGEELAVSRDGVTLADGTPHKTVCREIPTLLPNASRTTPPCQGDYPAYTEEEKAMWSSEWHTLYKDESRYNESLLTKAERQDRLQLKSDTERLSYLQAQIEVARGLRASRLKAAEDELARLNAQNEVEAAASAQVAEARRLESVGGDQDTLDAFKAWREQQAQAHRGGSA